MKKILIFIIATLIFINLISAENMSRYFKSSVTLKVNGNINFVYSKGYSTRFFEGNISFKYIGFNIINIDISKLDIWDYKPNYFSVILKIKELNKHFNVKLLKNDYVLIDEKRILAAINENSNEKISNSEMYGMLNMELPFLNFLYGIINGDFNVNNEIETNEKIFSPLFCDYLDFKILKGLYNESIDGYYLSYEESRELTSSESLKITSLYNDNLFKANENMNLIVYFSRDNVAEIKVRQYSEEKNISINCEIDYNYE